MKRIELKQHARETLRKHRGKAILGLVIPMVVVALVMGLLIALIAIEEFVGFVFLLYFVAIIAAVPINVGIFYFYRRLTNEGDAAEYGDLLKGHTDNFPRNLGRLVQMQIFINLWMILLIVPGIIKAFSYAMTPYILGDDDIKKDATSPSPITISRLMMDGHKMDLFVLILSFIGWFILGAITLNILTILFVAPYFHLTLARFYETLKADLDPQYLTSS